MLTGTTDDDGDNVQRCRRERRTTTSMGTTYDDENVDGTTPIRTMPTGTAYDDEDGNGDDDGDDIRRRRRRRERRMFYVS